MPQWSWRIGLALNLILFVGAFFVALLTNSWLVLIASLVFFYFASRFTGRSG